MYCADFSKGSIEKSASNVFSCSANARLSLSKIALVRAKIANNIIVVPCIERGFFVWFMIVNSLHFCLVFVTLQNSMYG
ncbi:MAG: hypothetical protein C0594_08845 [Marinilabiliales bacterium]|nr:MAG: hypothetical protein C0594_08845 [Marinilabiliales bacterium]